MFFSYNFITRIGIVFLSLFFFGCSNFRHKLDPDINYQKDLKFEIKYWEDEKWTYWYQYTGMAVIRESPKYKIKVYGKGKVDMIALTSCHRQVKTANPDTGWFSKGHEFEFTPVKDIETNRACPLDAGIYEQKKGRHGWASMAIDSSREKLPARVKCSGNVNNFKGTSVCQAKSGLIQDIQFKRPVSLFTSRDCQISGSGDGMNWEYLMPRGDCVMFFIDNMDERFSHKHVTFGYDTIPIRGIN